MGSTVAVAVVADQQWWSAMREPSGEAESYGKSKTILCVYARSIAPLPPPIQSDRTEQLLLNKKTPHHHITTRRQTHDVIFQSIDLSFTKQGPLRVVQ